MNFPLADTFQNGATRYQATYFYDSSVRDNAMMKKLKYLFLAAVCSAFIGGLSGVSAQVLVSGKQSLRQSDVDTIIKFYEWAFETTFNDDDRERFQELSVQAFRQDPSGSRKSADVLIGAYEKVQLKPEADQAKLRQTFNEGFIKDLRATNDEASALLLEIYDRTQGGSDTAGREPGPAATRTSRATLPACPTS